MSRIRHALALFCVLYAGAFAAFSSHLLPHTGEAFAAFYCAGEAVDARVDPYRIEPLRSCEHRVAPSVNPPTVVEPAPLPGYALLPFALLARMPYRVASILFLLLLLAALTATMIAISEITALPLCVAVAGFVVVDGALNAAFGETPPLAIAALALAGLALSRGRDRLAACAAAAAMIEPHLGLAACASLVLWRPRTRPVIAVCALLFAGVSILVSSPGGFVEYYARVLPLQSRAETPAVDQYSLTWLAHVAGLSDTLATSLGSLSFLVLGAVGVLGARRVARAYREPAMLVFFPVAASMLFGVFVHDIELPAAVLAALVIASARRGAAAWIAVGILSLAWMPWWRSSHAIVALSLYVAAAIGWTATEGDTRMRRMVFAAGVAAAYPVLLVAFDHLPHALVGAPVSPWPARSTLTPAMQAGLNWGTLIRESAIPPDQTLQLLVGKIIVWAALAYVLMSGLFGAAPRQPPAVRRRDEARLRPPTESALPLIPS